MSSLRARSLTDGLLASTTRILQYGQAVEIIDTSSVASTSQPLPRLDGAAGVALPFWLTMRRQPLGWPHGGSPKCAR